jgi:hypothetical protein
MDLSVFSSYLKVQWDIWKSWGHRTIPPCSTKMLVEPQVMTKRRVPTAQNASGLSFPEKYHSGVFLGSWYHTPGPAERVLKHSPWVHDLLLTSFFSLLVYVNCTKGFHCDISIHAHHALWSNSPPLLFFHTPINFKIFY